MSDVRWWDRALSGGVLDPQWRGDTQRGVEAPCSVALIQQAMKGCMGPGMIFDTLRPGESIGTIGPRTRPRPSQRCDGCAAREWRPDGHCAYCGGTAP